MQGVGGLICAALLGWYLASSPAGPGCSTWQVVLLTVIALDLIGGVLTNSTTATKSWYHRPGARRTRLVFVTSHLLHLALVGLLLLDRDWTWLLVSGALLLAATLLIELAPRPVKLVVATGSYTAVLVLGLVLAPLPAALSWFPALFYLKLLVCFLVPAAEARQA
ncbi:hypothetical protein [Aquipuribacter sp. MA13-6]|uniref:hypothetical protein n=1 Tax=unclassified Aquipuribacter TaxID=2635084 RepID=UPI003EEE6F0C